MSLSVPLAGFLITVALATVNKERVLRGICVLHPGTSYRQIDLNRARPLMTHSHSDFSDQELVQLAKALQEELDSYSEQQVPFAREEQVPLMLLPAEFISSSRNVVRFPRDRRAVGRLVRGDDGTEEEIVLEPLGAVQLDNTEDSDPIIVVPDEPAPEREQVTH